MNHPDSQSFQELLRARSAAVLRSPLNDTAMVKTEPVTPDRHPKSDT